MLREQASSQGVWLCSLTIPTITAADEWTLAGWTHIAHPIEAVARLRTGCALFTIEFGQTFVQLQVTVKARAVLVIPNTVCTRLTDLYASVQAGRQLEIRRG